MKTKGKAQKAFNWYQSLKNLIGFYRTWTIDRAELLYLGKEANYWKELGYDTWKQFIYDPDLQLTQSQVFRDLRCYRKYIIELDVPKNKLYGLNIRRLDAVAGYLTKKNAEEWLDKVRFLSDSDFHKEIGRLFKGKKDPMECKHVNKKSRTHCLDCGTYLHE